MPAKINLIGQRFGKLVVQSEAEKKGIAIRWNCLCDCGGTSISSSGNLRGGGSKSCGCENRKQTIKRNKENSTHGMTKSPVYQMWKILNDKYNVSDKWKMTKEGGKNFEQWIMSQGWEEGNNYKLIKKRKKRKIGPRNCKLILITKDLSGKQFNRLFVVGISKKKGTMRYWDCICDCGNVVTRDTQSIYTGTTKSCGCLLREKTIKRNKENATHGLKNHPLYSYWNSMKNRCYLTHKEYKYWNGKGIKVCKEWKHNPEVFIKWALQNKWEKGLSIHRKNGNGDYSPENCVFMTRSAHTILHNDLRYPKAR